MKDDRHPPGGAIRSFCAAPQDNPMAGKPTTAQRSQGSFSSRSDADLLLRPPSGYRRRFFFFVLRFCRNEREKLDEKLLGADGDKRTPAGRTG